MGRTKTEERGMGGRGWKKQKRGRGAAKLELESRPFAKRKKFDQHGRPSKHE